MCFGPYLPHLCLKLQIEIVLAFKCLQFSETLHSKSVIIKKKKKEFDFVIEECKIHSFKYDFL